MARSAPEPEIILDLSRLLSRALHATPTGIDRCEMAYARGLLDAVPNQLRFAAVHPTGRYGRLPHEAVLRFLYATEERWNGKGFGSNWEMRRFAAGALAAMWPRFSRRSPDGISPFYIQASPNNLNRPRVIRKILRYERARFICLVHDLIPLQYPEYARTGGAAEHEVRIRTIIDNADGIVCNSHATMNALTPWKDLSGRRIPTVVAHLGTHLHQMKPAQASVNNKRPYFISIGTIEPRKNHLLLLNIWRRMAEEQGAANIPKLILIGRRGWENEQVVDMLERCPALKECVEEQGRLSDQDVAVLLPATRALLMPSFAEGYGMPVAEALALGVPVICSDLPALREVGGDHPLFLDPLDGPGWMRAILALRNEAGLSPRPRANLAGWHAPTWRQHIAILLNFLYRIDT